MQDTEVLRVERDERIVLSPESRRFRANYREVRPRTASELRKVIGLSVEDARARDEQGGRIRRASRSFEPVAIEDLESKDEVIRARAYRTTGSALEDYVYALSPELDPRFLSQMEPVFAVYMQALQMVIQIAVLPDIEVADGSTLVISASTDVVKANNITIHGNGRILCHGTTRIEAASILGTEP